MRRQRWRRRPRPFSRSLADGVIFLVALLLVGLGARQMGWLFPESGQFTAIDGDSLRKGGQEYRLHGIDAPELHQACRAADGREYPCGREARKALDALVAGQTLDCAITDQDRYGRSVATCRAGGRDINAAMVKSGWAIAYRRHGTPYGPEEAEARAARRGIWQGRFENPERWREINRSNLAGGGAAD